MTASAQATIGACMRRARQRLPRLEADVLAAHALGVPRSHLYAFGERPVEATADARIADWVGRRAEGEPVAYIVGTREFWGLALEVTPACLIPRHDTETLVAAALERTGPDARVLDVGTGCGAVALAIASERADAKVVATDIDPRCVALCRRNAARLALAIDVHAADLFDGVEGEFDLIASNPPYVGSDDPHLQRGDLRFEPSSALDGGDGGLDVMERLVARAPAHLADGGWLCVEHGCEQGRAVRDLFAMSGFEAIERHLDLARRPRVTVGRKRA